MAADTSEHAAKIQTCLAELFIAIFLLPSLSHFLALSPSLSSPYSLPRAIFFSLSLVATDGTRI